MISPVQYHHHEGSPMSKEEKWRWEGFVEKVGFVPRVKEWRSDGCWEWRYDDNDDDNDDDDDDFIKRSV